MVKIKQKKTMNLPRLIEWVWENDITNKRYIRLNSNPPEYVWINENSNVELDEDMCISKNDTFTVEVDEEITEDTEITELYMRYNNDCIDKCHGMSISKFDKSRVKAFYIPNDDLTMTLIWTYEKGLVD